MLLANSSNSTLVFSVFSFDPGCVTSALAGSMSNIAWPDS